MLFDENLLTKKIILTSRDDYENVLDNLKKKTESNIRGFDEINVILVQDNFNDMICPKCNSKTIATIVDEDTNKILSLCSNCQLKFTVSL